MLCANKQHYRICKQGLRSCLDCQLVAEIEISGSLYLSFLVDQSEILCQCWLETFCYTSCFLGADWGWNSSVWTKSKG